MAKQSKPSIRVTELPDKSFLPFFKALQELESVDIDHLSKAGYEWWSEERLKELEPLINAIGKAAKELEAVEWKDRETDEPLLDRDISVPLTNDLSLLLELRKGYEQAKKGEYSLIRHFKEWDNRFSITDLVADLTYAKEELRKIIRTGNKELLKSKDFVEKKKYTRALAIALVGLMNIGTLVGLVKGTTAPGYVPAEKARPTATAPQIPGQQAKPYDGVNTANLGIQIEYDENWLHAYKQVEELKSRFQKEQFNADAIIAMRDNKQGVKGWVVIVIQEGLTPAKATELQLLLKNFELKDTFRVNLSPYEQESARRLERSETTIDELRGNTTNKTERRIKSVGFENMVEEMNRNQYIAYWAPFIRERHEAVKKKAITPTEAQYLAGHMYDAATEVGIPKIIPPLSAFQETHFHNTIGDIKNKTPDGKQNQAIGRFQVLEQYIPYYAKKGQKYLPAEWQNQIFNRENLERDSRMQCYLMAAIYRFLAEREGLHFFLQTGDNWMVNMKDVIKAGEYYNGGNEPNPRYGNQQKEKFRYIERLGGEKASQILQSGDKASARRNI